MINWKTSSKNNKGSRSWAPTLYFVISVVGGFGLWSLLGLLEPKLVATPLGVWLAAAKDLHRGVLIPDILYSLFRVVTGFVSGSLFGVAVGLLMGWYKPVRYLLEPWIQFLRMIPSIAIIPLVIVYFGVGETAKIFVIFLSVFLTMVIAAFQGVINVDPLYVKAAKVLGANDRQLFRVIILPASLPYMLVGLRLGLAAGWTTLVAAELIAASHGLGYMVQVAGEYFDIPNVYLGIVLIGMIGLLMDWLVTFTQNKLTPWQPRVKR